MLDCRFLLLFLPVCLASPAQAQSGTRFLRRQPLPTRTVHLDLASGVYSRGPVVSDRAAATVSDFANLDLGGFIAADSGGGACEWFQAGIKGASGNQSDLMSSIVFPYCTVKASPPLGPGGSVRLGFYEGYQLGGGTPTTAAAVLTLTGLPGNTGSGGFACYFVQVSFTPLVAFADGPIGYSWRFIDLGVGNQAGTFPFLATHSSGGAPPGVTGLLDRYCPPGSTPTTFSFGSVFTSISMDIREVADTVASSVAYNANLTPNPDVISAGPVVIGTNWSVTLTRGAPSAPGTFSVALRTSRLPLANGVQGPAPLPIGAGGRVLVSGPLLGALSGAHNGTVGAAGSPIPAQLGLVAVHWAAQATVLGGGVRLSSAVEGTTGTF